MKVISVNVGLPREVTWRGKTVKTGIFKEPVNGHVILRRLNLEGDAQADLSVHGGPKKAVYVYPAEHYEFWRGELADVDLTWGIFGENLTTEGLLEGDVRTGDRLRIGSTEVEVTQPRLPCFKLGIRFGRRDMPKLFLAGGRPGFYCAVLKEGEVAPGDEVELLARDENQPTVLELFRAELKGEESS
jgi:MOSC domain-containing protein YiiM